MLIYGCKEKLEIPNYPNTIILSSLLHIIYYIQNGCCGSFFVLCRYKYIKPIDLVGIKV